MKKVEINKNACIGCGACVSIAKDVFGYDDDGLSKVKVSTVEDDNQDVMFAAEGCPTGAISVSDVKENDDKCKCENASECSCGDSCECGEDCSCHK